MITYLTYNHRYKNIYQNIFFTFYVLFIDFSKAFDMIPYFVLLYILNKSGIHGRTLHVLRDRPIYSQMKACVRKKHRLTEFSNCIIETRQVVC